MWLDRAWGPLMFVSAGRRCRIAAPPSTYPRVGVVVAHLSVRPHAGARRVPHQCRELLGAAAQLPALHLHEVLLAAPEAAIAAQGGGADQHSITACKQTQL